MRYNDHNNRNNQNPFGNQNLQYSYQAKEIITNHQILQQMEITAHKKAKLANRDMSCMMKKD